MPPLSHPYFSCGQIAARLPVTRLKALVQSASEQRQLAKAQSLAPEFSKLNEDQQEWLLFSKLFRALGYGGWQDAFERLAEATPLTWVRQTLALPLGNQRLLGRWAGNLGLLQEGVSHWQPTCQSWGQGLLAHAGQPLNPLPEAVAHPQGRPQNHPLRRLSGMVHHLEATQHQGLLKTWLKLLWEAEPALGQPQGLKQVQDQVAGLFPNPPQNPLTQVLTPKTKKIGQQPLTLIGPERQRVLLVNAVIPFFLAYALAKNDRGLEKTLFGLFLLLPCEGENHKTLAMEARLLPNVRGWGRKGLSYAQGLIQLYEDWCGPEPTCQGCGLLRLLQSEHGAGADIGKQL